VGTADDDTLETDEDGVHRLVRMTVHEVSVVDRAANKRTFLLVKRDTMTDATKKNDPNAPAAAAAATPAAPPVDPASPPAAAAQPAPLKLTATVKSTLASALAGVIDKLVAAAKAIETAEVAEKADTPAELALAFSEAAKALSEAVSAIGPAAAQAPAAAAAAPATKALDAYTELHVTLQAASSRIWQAMDSMSKDPAAASATLKEVAAMIDSAVSMTSGAATAAPAGDDVAAAAKGLAKVGRRMAKDRLDRFRKAFDMLSDLLKELSDDLTAEAAKQPGGDAAPAPGVAPAAKRAPIDPIEAIELAKKSAELAKVQADLAAARADNERLQKTASASNALPVDGAPIPSPAQVVWPRDMNRPITRETVKPSHSFYDR
jgi:hypothetical protein